MVLKISEELNSMYELCGSQKYTKQLKNCRFFHETRWFLFSDFERTGTSDCLILHFTKRRKWNRRFSLVKKKEDNP